MKKYLSFILIVLLLCSTFSFVSNAAGNKAVAVSGDNVTLYCDGAEKLVIGGKEFSALGGESTFKVIVETDDSTSAHNTFYLNGKKLAKVNNGVNTLEIKMSDLKAKGNKLGVYIGTDSAVYNDKMVYGTMNLDDITVVSVRFVGVNFERPASVDLIMPIEGAAGTKTRSAEYKDSLRIGDGWFSDTGLGGSTPATPLACEYVFDMPDLSGTFIIDTTLIPDGEYDGEYMNKEKVVKTVKYRVDNTPPEIVFSAKDGAVITKRDKLDITVKDASGFKQSVLLDGKPRSSVSVRTLSEGTHTLLVTATDDCGNTSTNVLVFTLCETPFGLGVNENGNPVLSVRGEAALYSAKLLKNIRMYENRYGTFNAAHLRSSDEVLVSFDEKNPTVSYGGAYPYQSFAVDTEGANGELIVSYSGTTGNGVPLALMVWNPEASRFDTLAVAQSGVPVSFKVDPSVYSSNGKMRVNVVPKAVYNGSNTILWNSDTQYYSRYEDLHDYYSKVNNYAVAEYKNGNIAYCVHTGDLVDRTNAGAEIAHDEYRFASEAQSILDENGVPNGVVSGNHDINHTVADYSYYWKYFPASRYSSFDWFGGDLNNNMHHYDLVSVGRYDFVFIYLGCYMEIEDDTVAWVNSVCRAYPERNVILCMHEYLLPSGAYSGDRAPVIWEKMAVPNENVKMILCGHNEGVCDRLHEVEGTGRKVLEVLADYQFAENGQGPQHVENGCTCDGEGYIRLMTFTDGGQVLSTTYSPVAEEYGIDPYEYFPSFMDSFVYDVQLTPSDRSIKTEKFDVVYGKKEIGKLGEAADVSGCEAVFAATETGGVQFISPVCVLEHYSCKYDTKSVPEYSEPEAERYAPQGNRHVFEGLRNGESNSVPDPSLAESGLELMPSSPSVLVQTSGSRVYETKENGSGSGFSIHHSYSGANWVTLANMINKEIDTDKYDRIYFGVTAPKDAKWNIELNFTGKSLSFSRTKELAEKFGYINYLPSDIQGTWQGYIDLKEFVHGNIRLNSVYFVTATPEMTVSFDYLFLGCSKGRTVRFITDESRIVAYEAIPGGSVELPASPFINGHTFVGWYDAPDGGKKIETPVAVKDETVNVYARFTENGKAEAHKTEFFNDEPDFKGAGSSLLTVIIIVCIIIAAAALVFILLKTKKNKSKEIKK